MQRVAGATWTAEELPAGRSVVVFCTDWCGYCHRFLPHFRRVPGGIVVDISEEDEPAWDTYDLRVVPTVILFDGGKPVRSWAGALGATHVDEILATLAQDAS